MMWPKQPQRFDGEFEAAYRAYVSIVSMREEVPASREVILEEAKKGFDGVVRLLRQKCYSV